MTTEGDAMRSTDKPISLRSMGSFFFGGKVVRDSIGATFHGDHGYAQYFVPEQARDLPIIMWHGFGQSGKTWESTPDGREGFWQIFTRRDWPVVIIDQPRRGRAARAVEDDGGVDGAEIPTLMSEGHAWATFRLGTWEPPAEPAFFPGLSFPTDQAAIEQFMRQQVPNTGPEPFPSAEHREYLGGAVADLVDQVGPCVLMNHSHSGQYCWVTAMKSPDVRAIVAFEPGEYAFPADDPPADVPTDSDDLREFLAGQLYPAEQFEQLLKIPILVIFGDNIATAPSPVFGEENWRIIKARAQQFVAAVNKRGGNATYVELPDVGLHGNTHFPMTDLNNLEVAGLVESFLARHGLDTRDKPYLGPRGRQP